MRVEVKSALVVIAAVLLPAGAAGIDCPTGTTYKSETNSWSIEEWCEVSDEHGTRKHGPYRLTALDGRKVVAGEYGNGSQVGLWEAWGRDGNLQGEIQYKWGRIHGFRREYYESGSLRLEEHYNLGTLDGPFRLVHPNGQLKQVGSYESGEEAGRWTTWHPNGTKASEGDVSEGSRVGTWQYWDPKGNPTAAPPARSPAESGVREWDRSGDQPLGLGAPPAGP
jgi:antitoxin component YwqK of YwqJK toxin-antitoxin module